MENTRYKIVLVDDNIATLNQGKSLLRPFYKVHTVQSPVTFFENLEKDIPDMILLDVEMPEMSGFEVIKKLKADARYRDIPVMFLTSKSDEESEREGFKLGAVDYIAKPFSGPLLHKRISNQILYKRVQNAVKDYSSNIEAMMDEIARANERMKILLDKTPLACRLWDSSYNVVDCNEAAVRLFGFKDKQECLERYPELYPEYQPDGRRSVEKVEELIQKAFEEGGCSFDWTYKTLDGTAMPAEIILVRVELEDGYAVAGYTRDMREHNKMMRDIEFRNNLLQAVNRATAILLHSDLDSFENALHQSMKILAEAVMVDRVRVFKNHAIGGELYCTQLYEWSEFVESMHGKEITVNVSYGRQVPGWEELLSNGKCVHSMVRDMSPAERLHLAPQNILSIIVVPVFIEGQFWGHVGFDDCHRERLFTEEEISILSSTGLLFAEAMLRNKMVVNIRDTSLQLKAAAEKALEDEERMQLMLDAMPLACRLFGRNYKFIDCNQAALDLAGVTTKEEYIKTFNDLLPEFQPCGRPSQELKMEYLDMGFEKGYVRFDWMYRKLDGEPLPCEITFVRLMYKGEYIIAGYARDLREQKAVIEEMRRAEIAEESSKAKSRFLANMSHEIRTPMNSIMGFTELALDRSDSSQVNGYLIKILDSTRWLLRIVDDILDISKIEAGKMVFENIPFDLRAVILRCQSIVMPSAMEKGLELRINVEPPIGGNLMGDPLRLYQALMNLLYNAVKFTNTGTIHFSTRVTSQGDGRAAVYFEVKDTGIGMDPEQLDKVFESFIQADSSTTRNYGGTGLGLSITKNLVELMGGKLAVESSPGAGAKFSFELLFDTVEASGDISGDFNLLEKPRFDGLILICDDNPLNQQVICEHLASVGLRTMVAENGQAGVEMVEERIQRGEKPFDLILMDIFMPVMDGVEAASKITALDTKTPMVAMTANIMAGELKKYEEHGMPDSLGKPFTSRELWRLLLKYLKPVGGFAMEESDGELQKKLRVNFAKANQAIYAEISEAMAAGEIKLAHRLAHTLKGNAGQIGKIGLFNAAGALEALLKNGLLPGAEDILNLLKTELAHVLEELNPLLEESGEGPRPLNIEQAMALFEKLEPMLENINPECVGLVDDIRAVAGAEELARQVEDYDFESASRTLAELKKKWA